MIGQDARYKRVVSLMNQTQRIRNVSIVAHVDHGKTTLADCLIASNGLIHRKQAGQLKLLDDRLDEKDRGITMKSSSIALLYQDYLINLIDSPGHLEFHTEVSSALRLTDSALLVVDVVEGVSSQTYRVINQLYREKLPSILILNKIDKLITHCKMDPAEAYHHLVQLIEQVNALLGSFISNEVNINQLERKKSYDSSDIKLDQLESKFYFSTEKKNIIFGSALDNWGFTIESFGGLIANKLGKTQEEVCKYLWGDFYYHPKKKEFSSQPRNATDRPLCIDFILKPIWDIFENVQSQNHERIQKIINTLKLKINANTLKRYDFNLIKQIMNTWLPIDKVILQRIVEVLPNPQEGQSFRLPYLLGLDSNETEVPEEITKSLAMCDNSKESPVIVFVSKMVNIPKRNFNERGLNENKPQNQGRPLGFARIFSGRLRRGSKVFTIGAKRKKVMNETGKMVETPDICEVSIENLYFFNAQYPEGIEEGYAGNIVGIGGLQNKIFKSGTISSREDCISFMPTAAQTKNILKVSLSTESLEDNPKLMQGLKRLNRSDPSVDVYVQPSGDIILNTCGEVHLQKCLVDLEQIYCKVPVTTSQPLVSFKETIVWQSLTENKNQKFINEIKKKQEDKLKKEMLDKFKEELRMDAELDDLEKQKRKAIEEWDSHVEIYESEDLTVTDTRYFLKNREDMEKDEEKYDYKRDKETIKKTDHKNRGKMHSKQNFINLNLKTNFNIQLTPNQLVAVKIKALGVYFEVAEFLEKNSERMKKLFSPKSLENKKETVMTERIEFLKEFQAKLTQFNVDKNVQALIRDRLVAFGPDLYGPNLLIINFIPNQYSLFQQVHQEKILFEHKNLNISPKLQNILSEHKTSISELLSSIVSGFNLACEAGPLCSEPLMGVMFIIESVEAAEEKKEEKQLKEDKKVEKYEDVPESKKEKQEKGEGQKEEESGVKPENKSIAKPVNDVFGPLAGQIMSAIKIGCIQAFLGGSPRLVQPMYKCQIQTDQKFYGQIHNQLSKRKATIIDEDLHEISNLFIIQAYLPVIQSNHFCFDLMDKTQGTVNALLNLGTWKIIHEDPFFIPLTEEQIQENGVENVAHNPARILLERIRAKKGLPTTEKIVVAAEKQRNLKKK